MAEKYPLAELLRVRSLREEKMANEVSRCRLLVAEAEAMVEQRKRELVDYIAWRVGREEELYAQVMEQAIQRKELDELKLTIQILREKELNYEERIREAEKAVADALEALESAQRDHRAAIKARQKLDEHYGMWAQEVAKAVEYGLEKEMEDFPQILKRTDSIDEVKDFIIEH